jgi:hypothetical protein
MAWDVRRLVRLSRDLPVREVALSGIRELDEPHWYSEEGDMPTCRSLLGHMRLIDEARLEYPIILDEEGRVMDGMHRVCKAIREGRETLPAVRFETNPPPDYVGRDPQDLPYDDE